MSSLHCIHMCHEIKLNVQADLYTSKYGIIFCSLHIIMNRDVISFTTA